MNTFLPSWTSEILRIKIAKLQLPKIFKRKARNGRHTDKGPISAKDAARERIKRDTHLGTNPATVKEDANQSDGLSLEHNKETCEPLPLGEEASATENSIGTANAVVNPSEDLTTNMIEEYKSKIARLECTVDNLKLYLQSTQNTLADSQEDGGNFRKRMRVLRQEHNDLRFDLQRAQSSLTLEREEAKMILFEMQVKHQTQTDEHRRLVEEYEKDLTYLRRVVEKQKEEIACSRPFMSPNDLYSAADIIQMVNALNAEIFDLAAFAVDLVKADVLDSTDPEREMNIDMWKEWLMKARKSMGDELYIYLVTEPSKTQQKAKILQWAIQSIIVDWCESETALFSAGRSELEDKLEDLYKGISLHEMQAVAGRWRAMTSKAMRGEGSERSFTETALSMIFALLYLCGWSSSRPESKGAIRYMKQMASEIEDRQYRLKKAINEDVTSTNMEVFMHRRGKLFRKDMEDVGKETEEDPEDGMDRLRTPAERLRRILCTVGLGLRKSTRMGGEYHNCLLMKAKVVLDEVLDREDVRGEMNDESSRSDSPLDDGTNGNNGNDDDDMYIMKRHSLGACGQICMF